MSALTSSGGWSRALDPARGLIAIGFLRLSGDAQHRRQVAVEEVADALERQVRRWERGKHGRIVRVVSLANEYRRERRPAMRLHSGEDAQFVIDHGMTPGRIQPV